MKPQGPPVVHPFLWLGTSSWNHKDWTGTVYPPGTPGVEYLAHYAKRFRAVEVDATWYAIPAAHTVKRWREITPPGFQFAAKVPKAITHEKQLEGCGGEMKAFLKRMDLLEEKLGPLLLQFPFEFKPDRFEDLDAFLAKLPKGYRWAVEVRNRGWLTEEFYGMLEKRRTALCLVDIAWMPRGDRLTADFAYVRWIGDRKAIEAKTKTWGKIVVDRAKDLAWWAPRVRKILTRKLPVYAFFNNHYAGHAPGSADQFAALLLA